MERRDVYHASKPRYEILDGYYESCILGPKSIQIEIMI